VLWPRIWAGIEFHTYFDDGLRQCCYPNANNFFAVRLAVFDSNRLRGKMTHFNPSNDDFAAWRLVLWYTGLSASACGASDPPRLVGDGEGEVVCNRQILDGMRKRPGGWICGQHGKLRAPDGIYAKRRSATLIKLAILNNGQADER
jgi:hypothetical protein